MTELTPIEHFITSVQKWSLFYSIYLGFLIHCEIHTLPDCSPSRSQLKLGVWKMQRRTWKAFFSVLVCWMMKKVRLYCKYWPSLSLQHTILLLQKLWSLQVLVVKAANGEARRCQRFTTTAAIWEWLHYSRGLNRRRENGKFPRGSLDEVIRSIIFVFYQIRFNTYSIRGF